MTKTWKCAVDNFSASWKEEGGGGVNGGSGEGVISYTILIINAKRRCFSVQF